MRDTIVIKKGRAQSSMYSIILVLNKNYVFK